MKRTLFALMLIPLLALSACAARSAVAPEAPMPAGTMSADFAMGGAPVMGEAMSAPAEPESMMDRAVAKQAVSADRLVIRNADLSIVVSDVRARTRAIQNMASAMGGFVVSSNVYEVRRQAGEPVLSAQVVVRVPHDKLDSALDQIKADTVEVQNESQSGQDVTDQYVDLESRLRAKLATEEQLIKIMEEARRTEDVLAVYAQLQQVQTDIEVLRGQIRYLEQSAALSSISVNIIAEETIEPIEVGGWKPQGVARDAIQRLIYFWQDFVDFLIRFSLFTLPVLITLLIPLFLAFLVLRWIFRRLRKPRKQSPPAETAEKK